MARDAVVELGPRAPPPPPFPPPPRPPMTQKERKEMLKDDVQALHEAYKKWCDKENTLCSAFVAAFYCHLAFLGAAVAVLARGGIADSLCSNRSLSMLVLVSLNAGSLFLITSVCGACEYAALAKIGSYESYKAKRIELRGRHEGPPMDCAEAERPLVEKFTLRLCLGILIVAVILVIILFLHQCA